MKTIKQIADEIGVSKQAVQKRIAREPLYTRLYPYISTKQGVKYIEVVGENLIKEAFSDKIPTTEPTTVADNQVYTNVDDVHTLIILLQEDIRAKNQQITDLNAELAMERKHNREITNKLAKLTENAQTLHLGTMQQQLLPEASATSAPPSAEDASTNPTVSPSWFDKIKKALFSS